MFNMRAAIDKLVRRPPPPIRVDEDSIMSRVMNSSVGQPDVLREKPPHARLVAEIEFKDTVDMDELQQIVLDIGLTHPTKIHDINLHWRRHRAKP